MMSEYRLYRAPGGKDDGLSWLAVGASGGTKSDGVDLASLPFDFGRAVKGPAGEVRYPLLWSHSLGGEYLPLGVVDVLTGPRDLPMRVRVTFDKDDEFARKVAGKYARPEGGLSGLSLSWDPVGDDGISIRATGKKAIANQVLELSCVNVPLDAASIMDGARAMRDREREALADLAQWLDARLARQRQRERERVRDRARLRRDTDDLRAMLVARYGP